jgi:hypothetical protein
MQDTPPKSKGLPGAQVAKAGELVNYQEGAVVGGWVPQRETLAGGKGVSLYEQLNACGCGSGRENLDGNGRHFVPGAAFEKTAVALFEHAAPLFAG